MAETNIIYLYILKGPPGRNCTFHYVYTNLRTKVYILNKYIVSYIKITPYVSVYIFLNVFIVKIYYFFSRFTTAAFGELLFLPEKINH